MRPLIVLLGLLLVVAAMLAPVQAQTVTCDADGTCTVTVHAAIDTQGDCANGVCRRPVASAVSRAGAVPVRAMRAVCLRVHRRPILKCLRTRLLAPRCRAGCR